MNNQSLRLLRNVLLRSFVVGLIIAFVLGLGTMMSWTTFTEIMGSRLHADEATLAPLVLEFFLNVRFFLLFILLTPALAIHWTIKKDNSMKK